MSSVSRPDPSPFVLPGGPVGVLLIHGFAASPGEMRRVGFDLHERGLTVVAPLLIIYSMLDKWIAPDSAQFTYEHVGTRDKLLFALHNSGRVVTLDSEWEVVAHQTHHFICHHSPAGQLAPRERE